MRRFLVAVISFCLLSGAAVAFEQTGSKAAMPSAGQKADSNGQGALGIQSPSDASKPDSGSAVRIPGLGALGTLGVLPKLDFGLELLYGEGRAEAVKPRDDDAATDSDGLQIKGTFKHRF